MNHGVVVQLLVSGVFYGTPLLVAAMGELLAERSGILNLGVEGMMLMGAVTGFWVSQSVHGSTALALILAIGGSAIAGLLMAALHAFVCVTLRANQIVSGLALTILGGSIGLSSYIGEVRNLTGRPGFHQMSPVDVAGLAHLPVIGPLVFHEPILVYASWVLVVAVAIYLGRTRLGLALRAVGESPSAADAMGVRVGRLQYAHTLAGGALAGIAGASYSLMISPQWSEGMTAGAGWIAIGLVVLALWNPKLIILGAYLFGTISGLGFVLQARGVRVPPEVFSAAPYLMTIVALIVVSTVLGKRRRGAPASLGQPYFREES